MLRPSAFGGCVGTLPSIRRVTVSATAIAGASSSGKDFDDAAAPVHAAVGMLRVTLTCNDPSPVAAASTTKTNRIRPVSVGTAKKSTDDQSNRHDSSETCASSERWLRRRGIGRETVRSETSKPSFTNSPWMRGAHPEWVRNGHHPGAGVGRRTDLRPPRGRDWRVQYRAKPRRCQATTVAGRTTTKADSSQPRPIAVRSRIGLTKGGLRSLAPLDSQLLQREVLQDQSRCRLARTIRSRATRMKLATIGSA